MTIYDTEEEETMLINVAIIYKILIIIFPFANKSFGMKNREIFPRKLNWIIGLGNCTNLNVRELNIIAMWNVLNYNFPTQSSFPNLLLYGWTEKGEKAFFLCAHKKFVHVCVVTLFFYRFMKLQTAIKCFQIVAAAGYEWNNFEKNNWTFFQFSLMHFSLEMFNCWRNFHMLGLHTWCWCKHSFHHNVQAPWGFVRWDPLSVQHDRNQCGHSGSRSCWRRCSTREGSDGSKERELHRHMELLMEKIFVRWNMSVRHEKAF